MSVPVGRCGPCCSTLPAGKITTGFFLSCCAISGCVSSMKCRLGSMRSLLGRLETGSRLVDDIGDFHRLAFVFDGTQCRVDHSNRDIAVVRAQLAHFTADAALREHVELGAE